LSAVLRSAIVDHKFTSELSNIKPDELISKSDVDTWCELTPTNLSNGLPALDYIKLALNAGKHVITTNKGPVSLYYNELKKLANENKVTFQVEGTVMAGTPVINLLKGPLAGCKISKITGILNGTTNYILSEMACGKDYHEVLLTAQKLGYAESDPIGDVEGYDAMAKVKILARLALDVDLKEKDIFREGIQGITKDNIREACLQNKCIKLVSTLDASNGSLKASVKPESLPASNPLAGVNGNLNALTFTTDLLGDVTIIGPGAGKEETGFAVVNGLINTYQLQHNIH